MERDDWVMFGVLLLGAGMIAWASVAIFSMYRQPTVQYNYNK